MSATAQEAWFYTLLREAYPRDTAKLAARAADAPIGTAKGWAAGRFAPSAEILLRMADRCDRFASALERRLHDRRAAAADGRRE